MALKRALFTSTFLSAVAFSASAAWAGPAGPLIVDDGNAYDVSGPETYTSVWIGQNNPGQALNVLDGGSLSSNGVNLGLNPGAGSNSATVEDGGTWTNATNIIIGDKGGGNSFTVEAGGTVTSDSTWLGFQSGATENDLLVSGSLTNSNQLVVGGDAGGNTVTISGGGSIASVQSIVGLGSTATGNSVTVTGEDSVWTNSGILRFGYAGGGNTLDILAGGTASVGTDMIIGQLEGAGGNTLTVDGEGSLLSVTKTLYVGQSSDDNSLTVSNGGTLLTGNARIGGGDNDSVANSSGNSVTVTGSGSSWVASGKLRIGDGSPTYGSSGNSLTVADGASASFTEAYIGFSELDSGNALIVTGTGSSVTADAIFVGASSFADDGYTDASNSLLEVTDGGSVMTSALVVGTDSRAEIGAGGEVGAFVAAVAGGGSLNVGAGGVLGSYATIAFEGGTIGVDAGGALTAWVLMLEDGSTLRVGLSDSNPAVIMANNAMLGGTLEAVVGQGGLQSNRYDVLSYGSAEGSFSGLTLSGSGAANFTGVIGYDPNTAYVLFNADLGKGERLNRNQNNVADALDDYFNGGGVFTTAIASLYGLTGSDLKQALTEASGELGATGGVNAIERATTSFLNLMLGGGGQSAVPGAAHRMASVSNMNAGIVPTADVPTPDAGGWSLWGGVYGGAANIPGSSADGSHDTDTNVGGIAAGWDYDITPDARVGVALAGGKTNWDLDAGLGNGDSTFLQLGGYGTQHLGASYLSLGAAYAWHSMSTDRHVDIDGSEKLDADFNASNLSGRIEAGHRFAAGSQLGLTPYAAFQAQAVWMPGYREHGAAADESFAVSYHSNTATALRSELGVGIDTALGLDPEAASVFGRVAWAHDWNSDPDVQASFVSLDMGTFTVYGADTPANVALVTAGAEFGLSEATRLAATFDGEFGSDYQSYAGSVALRYSW